MRTVSRSRTDLLLKSKGQAVVKGFNKRGNDMRFGILRTGSILRDNLLSRNKHREKRQE
jgi:hypothetical protein